VNIQFDSRENIKRAIVDRALKSNNWIECRKHGGIEYVFGLPGLTTTTTLRQEGLAAIAELLQEKKIKQVAEMFGPEISIRFYDLTVEALTDTPSKETISKLLLIEAKSNGGAMKVNRISSPPFVQSSSMYDSPAETRIRYLAALDYLVAENKLKQIVSSSTSEIEFYSPI
jgi:hypothetical protein